MRVTRRVRRAVLCAGVAACVSASSAAAAEFPSPDRYAQWLLSGTYSEEEVVAVPDGSYREQARGTWTLRDFRYEPGVRGALEGTARLSDAGFDATRVVHCTDGNGEPATRTEHTTLTRIADSTAAFGIFAAADLRSWRLAPTTAPTPGTITLHTHGSGCSDDSDDSVTQAYSPVAISQGDRGTIYESARVEPSSMTRGPDGMPNTYRFYGSVQRSDAAAALSLTLSWDLTLTRVPCPARSTWLPLPWERRCASAGDACVRTWHRRSTAKGYRQYRFVCTRRGHLRRR
jgi:hypothetical protein